MTHSLTLGSLLLTDTMPDDDHGFVFNVLAEGVGFGVAAGVQEVVTSLMSDGDFVRTRRYGNREVTFAVEMSGPSLAALAHGEAALRREVGRPNTLTWQAPDIFSVPTVFEVVASEMSQTFDDLDELRNRRRYTLTLTCLPFARSLEPVTVEAMVYGTANEVVDTCDVATGWTARRNGAPATATTFWEAGSVSVAELDNATGNPPETWTLIRTGPVDFSATPYLVAELRVVGSDNTRVSCVVDRGLSTERTLPLMELRKMATGAHSKLIWDATGAGTVSTLTFSHTTNLPKHAWQGLFIRLLSRTDVSPGVTVRQPSRIIEVGGTERTPASIHVSSANGTDSLETVIVHTYPEDGSGYAPPLRRWRVGGNSVTPTFDAMSGAYEPIHPNAVRAEVPNSALPSGGYILAARMATDTAGTHRIAWSTSTVAPFGGANLVGGIEDVTFFNANQWIIAPLAFVTLPTIDTTGSAIVTRIDIQRYAGTALINMDEAWLFRAEDDCALTVVGGVPAHLWLDSPSPGSLVPKVWLSGTAERDNMRHPAESLLSGDSHILHPDGTTVFTAAVSNNPQVSATAYPRYHSNAAS